MGAMDEGILAEFLAESFENLAQVEHDLVALERDPEDRKRIGGIFRAVHTIKGTCGFFGFKKLEALAHAGENLLSRLRCGEIAFTPSLADTLLRLVDALHAILSAIETTRQEGDQEFAPLIEELVRLERAPSGTSTPPDSPSTAEVETGAPPRGGLLDPLIAEGRLDPDAVALAAQQQRLGDPRRIGEILVDNGALKPQDVLDALLARGEAPALAHGESTIRVDVELLDLLMNLVGELVLARNQLLQKVASADLADLPGTTQRLNLITTELQEGIMKTRMQPIANLCNKLPRLVRDLSIACGKEVRLELEGIDTELDRTIIDAIRDPLTHLIRNAIDHGIETSEVRLARGKAAEGRILVRAYHEGGKVHLEVTDDGDGLPIARIREKATRAGLVPAERIPRMTDRDWAQLIFQPGFSTAERVTNVSGRGVGMDVVKTNVERIGGAIEVDSQPGRGATVRIRIPLTLAIVPALIVAAAGERYAVPQVNLLELIRVEGDLASISITTAVDASLLRYRGGLLPLVDLRDALHVPADDAFPTPTGARPIAVLQADGATFGLVVDAVETSQEIVVKSLGDPLRQIPVFAGATILGDGKVALILDVPGLARHCGITVRGHAAMEEVADEAPTPVVPTQTLILCRAGGYPVAIPQSDIARLEEFPCGTVERLGERRVVQYRGGLLPLVPLAGLLGIGADTALEAVEPAAGGASLQTIRVVVVEREGHAIGLAVEEIVEILEEPIVPEASPRAGVRGSAVIRGHATDLLNLEALLASSGQPAMAAGA
ncbi:MAG TPA: chemotaxis protein CheA [Candidatus Omnitrophota bacterium]|nr:chemotaxis protein CheA [Candidatus Omnitrophota bacterium]